MPNGPRGRPQDFCTVRLTIVRSGEGPVVGDAGGRIVRFGDGRIAGGREHASISRQRIWDFSTS